MSDLCHCCNTALIFRFELSEGRFFPLSFFRKIHFSHWTLKKWLNIATKKLI